MRRGLALGAAITLATGCWPAAGQATGARRRVSSPVAFYNDADPSTAGMVNISEYFAYQKVPADRKSTRLNSSHIQKSRMPSSA